MRGARGGQQPGGPGRRARARCRSRASSTSSATTSWRTRRRSSSASRPGARCGCATPTSSPARRGQGRRRRDRRAALHLRSRDARRQARRTAARSRARSTGSRRATPSTPRCGSTSTCSTGSDPDDGRGGRRLPRQPEPELAGGADRLQGRARALADAAPGERFQFERIGYFCVDPDDQLPAARSSTAPSPCATPGPSSSSAADEPFVDCKLAIVLSLPLC